jgi:hypothetical protein
MGKLVRIIAHTRMKIYIDGAYYAKEDAKISVFDHGLLYGDGITAVSSSSKNTSSDFTIRPRPFC